MQVFLQGLQVPIAFHAVQNDARNFNVLIECGKPMDECGDRLGLMGRIDHEYDGQVEYRGKIGSRPLCSDRSIIKPHNAFYNNKIGVFTHAVCQVLAVLSSHGPRIKVDAGPATGSCVKLWIDVVRPHFRGSDPDTAVSEGPEQPQGDGGLSAG